MVAISFIALQCFQCSTMQQVKQQKKSSNKWVCAVCNERQSVRRVHARSHLAKDVRLFVQSFNMSRIPHPADVPDRTLPLLRSDQEACGEDDRRKRMDWTEYLDPDLEEEGEEKNGDGDGGFESEPKITTELPQKKFERIFPKCPRDRGGPAGGDQLHPISSKRRPDHCQGDTVPKKYQKINMAKTESKWSDYLEVCAEEEESVDTDGLLRSGVKFQFSDVAQVEEEVHPDFK
ncbi:hypothetical protein J5N97_003916 [Dioscorea zingiberensis]|uniref:MRN complex-interacting protein N-terminal domain-containing protein n=1 Tax=Dioscorea zingiberensis TaxID=325984 RepID=A0A9D5HQI0_9LILI|nr:hypothetical protein J5N97_003916 [Dioscorea zingiberensis]